MWLNFSKKYNQNLKSLPLKTYFGHLSYLCGDVTSTQPNSAKTMAHSTFAPSNIAQLSPDQAPLN